jgi:GNAT superfamily N-acetyltransferase
MKDAFGVEREAISKGGLRRVAVKGGSAVFKHPKVANRLDIRASSGAEQLLPTGTKLANGARVKGHKVSRTSNGVGKDPKKKGFLEEIGANRHVETTVARGRKNIGSAHTTVLPTKHTFVNSAEVIPSERGKGVGTSLIDTAVGNAPKAKIPAFAFGASKTPGTGSRAKRIGANTWRRKGVKYMPGVGINPGRRGEAKLNALGPDDRASAEKFMRKAKWGRVRPDQLKSHTTPAAGAALDRANWGGYVKGGEPFGRKTMIGTGGVAAGAGVAHEKKKK